jgi:hypothetical protein
MSVGTLVAVALGILGILGALVALALYGCGRAVASVAAAKLKGWLPHVAAALIATAVARLPETDRDRYHEEWLGELMAYQDRPVTALIFAVGVRRRVGDVAKELPSSSVPDPTAKPSIPVTATAMAGETDQLADHEFGRLLRKARDEAGLSTVNLTWGLHDSGTASLASWMRARWRPHYSTAMVDAWMRGTRRPTREVVSQWEQLCGQRFGTLLGPWDRLPPRTRARLRSQAKMETER